MPRKIDNLKDRLARHRQIKLIVIGRKTGQTISIPVWLVLEDDKLYLLPVKGSDTQWYRNVLKNPSIRIDARSAEAAFQATPITDDKVNRVGYDQVYTTTQDPDGFFIECRAPFYPNRPPRSVMFTLIKGSTSGL